MQKATLGRIRIHNTKLVLKTIYNDGPISRADVARATKLTRPTISEVVTGLLQDKLIEEVGYAPSKGGKRAILLGVDENARDLVSVDLSRGDFRGALINLRGEIKHRVDLPLDNRDGEAALELVYKLIDELINSKRKPILGIGIGAPGLVDAVDGIMHQSVNLSWRDIPLRDLLQERYQVPVHTANDCQVAAMAEYTFGDDDSRFHDLVVIAVGWGVGAGILLNGELLHGNPLGAGEIGHVSIVENGRQCACGNYGCLETIASSRSIIREAKELFAHNLDSSLHQYANKPDEITLEVICQASEAGDEAVEQLIFNVGRGLGIAAANLVGVLGSCRILIVGSVSCFGTPLIEVIQQQMSQRTLPALAQNTEIGFASLGPDIVLRGAAALLLHHELGVL